MNTPLRMIRIALEQDTVFGQELASLVAQMVNNLPAIQETQVQSLGWEDPLQKRNDTHSSILAWRIPCTEEPGKLYLATPTLSGHIFREKKILRKHMYSPRLIGTILTIAKTSEKLNYLSTEEKIKRYAIYTQLNIQKTKIMASGPITSWEIDGETVENSVRLYFGGLQNHCRW